YYPFPLFYLYSFPTRRSSDLLFIVKANQPQLFPRSARVVCPCLPGKTSRDRNLALTRTTRSNHRQGTWTLGDPIQASMSLVGGRSEEHTSELQSQSNLVCRLL